MDADKATTDAPAGNARLGLRLNNIDRLVLLFVCLIVVFSHYWSGRPMYLLAIEDIAETIVVFGLYVLTLRRLFALRWSERFEWKCPGCGTVVLSNAILAEMPVCRQCNLPVRIPPTPGRKEKIIKVALYVLPVAIVAGLILWWKFQNFSEEQDAKRFLQQLRDHQYKQAYAMFGCTDAHPCSSYSMDKFMEDWGPASDHPDAANAKIGLSQSCGNGVLLRLDYRNAEPVMLIVDRKTDAIGFAPPGWVECPGKHWHFGRFFRSLFGGE